MANGPIAFPWQIGCGLAGGHWPDYEAAIAEFAAGVPVPVLVVRRRAGRAGRAGRSPLFAPIEPRGAAQ
jgi:hypothetical protein